MAEKQTVYIDVDDEITAIIDKIKSSSGKIVALVLPKRATVLQSSVNMKLLKKAGKDNKKNLVLITSEAGLLPLAGTVGLHVAKSLQSKPEIPPVPKDDSLDPEISEALDNEEPEIDKTKSVGDLSEDSETTDDTETIELAGDEEATQEKEAASPKKQRSIKGFKIPNFDRFRLSFFLIILAVILLIGGWVIAAIILPTANITIQTDTTSIPSSINFEANTATTDLSLEKGLVPSTQKEVKKNDTEKATATGQKDNGASATGTITVRNCDYTTGFTIPAGSSFNAGSKSYISADAVTVPAFTGLASACTLSGSSSGKANVSVTAQNAGPSYNADATAYSVPGVAAGAHVDAIGSAMTGGTSNLITVVSQSDVDNAVAKMKGRQDDSAKADLATQLKNDGLLGLQDTLVISDPVVTANPAVGQPATGSVTVATVTTYDILGVKADYLNQLIKKDVAAKVEATKQGILDNGVSAATITVANRKSPTDVIMSLQTTVVAGPTINPDTLKVQIKGKKKGDTEQIISSQTGVTGVTVKYSPFWVYATPRSVKKITITIEKPTVKPAVKSQTPDVRTP